MKAPFRKALLLVAIVAASLAGPAAVNEQVAIAEDVTGERFRMPTDNKATSVQPEKLNSIISLGIKRQRTINYALI